MLIAITKLNTKERRIGLVFMVAFLLMVEELVAELESVAVVSPILRSVWGWHNMHSNPEANHLKGSISACRSTSLFMREHNYNPSVGYILRLLLAIDSWPTGITEVANGIIVAQPIDARPADLSNSPFFRL
jgi:hypothetical protein